MIYNERLIINNELLTINNSIIVNSNSFFYKALLFNFAVVNFLIRGALWLRSYPLNLIRVIPAKGSMNIKPLQFLDNPLRSIC